LFFRRSQHGVKSDEKRFATATKRERQPQFIEPADERPVQASWWWFLFCLDHFRCGWLKEPDVQLDYGFRQ
jgi:hypothetical protein